MEQLKKLVMSAWEIGRTHTGCGIKVGGMGTVMHELPVEFGKYLKSKNLEIQIEVLSPCFGFYDRSKLCHEESVLDERFHLQFEVLSHTFEDCLPYRIKHIYFWNEEILGQFKDDRYPQSIYPLSAWDAIRIYARVASAMARYLENTKCDALHLHDYHVGLIPFYIPPKFLESKTVVFTIHNASYQGWMEVWQDPAPVMYELSMPVDWYYRYFQYWGHFNTLKGILLKLMEIKGVVTTVSESYAQELCLNEENIRQLAISEKIASPQKIFLPNGGLSELAWSGIIGINNGLSDDNKPENIEWFKAETLKKLQSQQEPPLFRHPTVQEKMLEEDHNYSWSDTSKQEKLRELLYLECFQGIPDENDIVFCTIGRLVPQKNFDVLLGCMESIIYQHPNVRFAILASPVRDDGYGEGLNKYFTQVSQRNPNIYYSTNFITPLAKLILAGSNFCIIPSHFEPCGLVDYEAAVLGAIPIVRKTGGLSKTLPHAFCYSWYDYEDSWGESFALTSVIEKAIDEFTNYITLYQKRVQGCMEIDTSWTKSVEKYLQLLKII